MTEHRDHRPVPAPSLDGAQLTLSNRPHRLGRERGLVRSEWPATVRVQLCDSGPVPTLNRAGSGPAAEAEARGGCRVTYTAPEVAEMLGISRATVYVLLRSGEIPARRVGSRWIIARRRFDSWLDGDARSDVGVQAVGL
jgi:excisionase family DNA binding protein